MDVKAYIESGILENFALGEVSEQERREVECLSKIYPEIMEARSIAEDDLEKFARLYAVKAPSSLRERVLSEVAKTQQKVEVEKVDIPEDDPVVRRLRDGNTPQRILPWVAVAAGLAALIAIWQFMSNNAHKQELQALKQEQNELKASNEALENRIAELTESEREALDPDYQQVVLEPIKSENADPLPVLWNTTSGKVKINLANLPALPPEKQYQLWVLKGGVPSSMGVLPKYSEEVFLTEDVAMSGDSFAITIEPLGGKPEPTLDQLVYLGNTKIS